MNFNTKFVVAGLLVSLAGTWLILRPATADPTTADVAAPAGDSDNDRDDATPEAGDDEEGGLRSEQVDSDELDAPGDEVGPAARDDPAANPASQPSGEELEGLTLQTIPPPIAENEVEIDIDIDDDSNCDTSYAGLGVEFRSWGDVLLPYTPGYPTNEPGERWDCTADTVFGAAIAMTHAAYLEALRPEIIPTIAIDSPGRSTRISRHSGSNEAASLGFLCAPIGWNWDGADTWSLLHQCGDGDAHVSYYRMEHRDGRWWLDYPPGGNIETGPPPEDYAYYPFIGGG